MLRIRRKTEPRPLNPAQLEELALHYAARYATSRARLAAYLARKLRERGWDGERPPDVDALVERLAALRYVDDASFASARGASLRRRGYGKRRIAQALDAAGISDDDRTDAMPSDLQKWEAANAFARKRRLGPYGPGRPQREDRQKQVAAFVRAGHDFATAATWVDAPPDEPPPRPEEDDDLG
jgi:regulatory protein